MTHFRALASPETIVRTDNPLAIPAGHIDDFGFYPTKSAAYLGSSSSSITATSAFCVTTPARVSIPLYAHNADAQLPPASVIKVLTAMILVDLVPDLSETFTVITEDQVGGSGANVSNGDVLTFEDALYNILLPSSGVTSAAVARVLGGTMPGGGSGLSKFVGAMNALAESLGMANTVCMNAWGRGEVGQHMSARDMVTMGLDAIRRPLIASAWRRKDYTVNVLGPNARSLPISNTNQFVSDGELWARGGKTGTTGSGTFETRNLLLHAETTSGERVMIAVVQSTTNATRYADALVVRDIVRRAVWTS